MMPSDQPVSSLTATESQRQAIETEDRPLQVEAGAGAGKTWVLTQRYIYLLEAHPDWPIESLVAVTFTEKAAREMRTRIRSEVEKRAVGPGSSWLLRRAELEGMQVSTIHSLCARILRENAIPAGIDPLFIVLDEQQSGLLQEDAIEQTIAEISETDSPCLELLAALRVRDLRELMSGLLARRGTVQHELEALPSSEELLARWRAGLVEMRQTAWERYQKDRLDLKGAIHSLGTIRVLDPQDKLAAAVEHARVGILCLAIEELGRAFTEWAQIKRSGGKAANWGGKEQLDWLQKQLAVLQAAGKEMEKAGCTQEIGPLDEQAAEYLQLWRDLWQRLDATYTRLKDARQALDFDDLELLTDRLLHQTPRDPRLQAYLDGIHHLMVDEYQDTNPVQQRIVYALAHPEQSEKLFVVGDAKQSIYRFRQAQVTIFNRTGQDIRRVTGKAPVRLDTSFRSHTALIAALNHLFETILRPAGKVYVDYEAPAGPLQAQRIYSQPTTSVPAPVELILLPKSDGQEKPVSAEDSRLFEARLLAERLLQLQAEGFRVWDKETKRERPFRFNDAAILFRSTTSLPVYEEQFKAAGLPYLTVSGRGYYLRPEVRDLTALLTCLYSPGDDLSLASALRSPLFSLSDETLYRLRWRFPDGSRSSEPIPYRRALQNPPETGQPESVSFAAQVMDELWGLSGRSEVWEILRTGLDRTGFEAALTLDDGGREGAGRKRSNVQKFMELARGQAGVDLSSFLESLEDLRTREAREGEALGSAPESGAVQLMSIHAAKGLEFPVVAAADLGRQNRQGETDRIICDPAFGLACQFLDENGQWQTPAGYAWGSWLSSQMDAAEAKRLLYVACTRAADLLILSGTTESKDAWMSEICAAWQVPFTGAEDEILEKDSFRLHILRPAYQESPSINRIQQQAADSISSVPLSVPEIPLLARPLVLSGEKRFAVTRLGDASIGGEGQRTTIHPAARRCPEITPGEPCPPDAPAYLVRKLVHRALADWDCLELPASALNRRLEALARREGLFERSALEDAFSRARRMISHLVRSPLYQEINQASRRLHEVPLTLETPAGVLNGLLDLLYRDQGGIWHVLDWKTEWVKPEQLEAKAAGYAFQMAAYAEAVHRLQGSTPVASICFLPGGVKVVNFSADQLRSAWEGN